jgi:hypothetical protein
MELCPVGLWACYRSACDVEAASVDGGHGVMFVDDHPASVALMESHREPKV